LFLMINHFAGNSVVLDGMFRFIANPLLIAILIFSIVFYGVILPFIAPTPKDRLLAIKRALLLATCFLCTQTVIEILKMVVAFPRPVQVLGTVHSLIVFGNYDSFPSAHTAFAFMVATFSYQYSKRIGALLYILAVFVGMGRILVGVHFPLDVLVGAVVGAIVPLVLIRTFRRDSM